MVHSNFRGNKAVWAGMKGRSRRPDQIPPERSQRLLDSVKLVCQTLRPFHTISTRDLVDAVCREDAADQRDCYALLKSAAWHEALAAYWTRGAPVSRPNGSVFRPFIWHCPSAVCPHCNGSGYLAKPAKPAEPETWTA